MKLYKTEKPTRPDHRLTGCKASYHLLNIFSRRLKLRTQIPSENGFYEMSSFFPWMGGKSRVAKRLAELLPEHTCYVEVFAGAANLLFAKEPAKTEVINDINSELVNLLRITRWHPRELINELAFVLHSRKDFVDYRNQPGLTDIQRAARSWFIMKTAFGGKGGTSHPCFGYGTSGKSRLRRTAFTTIRKCHKRLDGVFVENLDFAECIQRYDRPHTVFYNDPPYVETAGYKSSFSLDDHQRLAEALKSIKGKFLLSANDHSLVRRLYKGLPRLKVKVRYTVARDEDVKTRGRDELVIANYPLPKKW